MPLVDRGGAGTLASLQRCLAPCALYSSVTTVGLSRVVLCVFDIASGMLIVDTRACSELQEAFEAEELHGSHESDVNVKVREVSRSSAFRNKKCCLETSVDFG